MIEVKERGIAKSAYAGEAIPKKGRFVYVAGKVASVDTPLGTAGYSSAGDTKVLIANGHNGPWGGLSKYLYNATITSGYLAAPRNAYPVNKYEYQPESSDFTLDTIASGESCHYFVGGEYETDQWSVGAVTEFTNAVPGDGIALDHLGRLTRSAGYLASGMYVAEFVRLSGTPLSGGVAGQVIPNWNGGHYPASNHGLAATVSDARSLWYRLLFS
jgi:hypothetical protein